MSLVRGRLHVSRFVWVALNAQRLRYFQLSCSLPCLYLDLFKQECTCIKAAGT